MESQDQEVFYRFLKDKITKDIIKRVPVFIVGDSNSSESFIRKTKNQKNSPYNVIGIISDKPSSIGRRIHNVPILTSIADIDSFEKKLAKKK